jgi:hypothetical protein
MIPISSINAGGIDDYLQGEPHAARVASLVKALTEGVTVPPITVFQVFEKRFLADGRHRLRAHQVLGRTEIAVDLIHGIPWLSGESRKPGSYGGSGTRSPGTARDDGDQALLGEDVVHDAGRYRRHAREMRGRSHTPIAIPGLGAGRGAGGLGYGPGVTESQSVEMFGGKRDESGIGRGGLIEYWSLD